MALVAPMAPAANWYVATNGTGGGTSWADATNSIQGAIAASAAADTVWVSNGVYNAGGITNYPAGTVLTNRVAIWKAITVRSANNDPTNTVIKGAWDPATNGPAAVRCVYMTNGSALIGFTLTNGATLATGAANDQYGGGIWSQSTNTVISNCVLTGNATFTFGGGAFGGTLFNCTLSKNVGVGGLGYGAGAFVATLFNCTLIGNSSVGYGGGAYAGALFNCTLIGNSARDYGGGVYNGTLYNCTVTGNSSGNGGGIGGAPVAIINSIVYFNSGGGASNYFGTVWATNSCTAPLPSGPGNITSDPTFITNGSGYGTNHVAGNYRLSEGSPARNAGTNFSWMTGPADVRSKDLDGQHRIDGYSRQVDMGAYEYFFRGTIFTMH